MRASYSRFADQMGSRSCQHQRLSGHGRSLLSYGTTRTKMAASNPEKSISTGELLGWSNVNPADPGSSTPVNQISKSLETADDRTNSSSAPSDQTLARPLRFHRVHAPLPRQSRVLRLSSGRARSELRSTSETPPASVVDATTGFVLELQRALLRAHCSAPRPAPGPCSRTGRMPERPTDGLELQVRQGVLPRLDARG